MLTSQESGISNGDKLIKFTIGETDSNINTQSILKNGFYEKIKDLKFKEYLGEYQNNSDDRVSSENKQTKRIITYIQN